MIKMQKCHIVSHWPSLTCVTKCQTRANRRGALTSEVSWDPMAAVGRPGSCGKTWKNRNTPKPGHGSSWPWPWHHGTMAGPSWLGQLRWVDISCVMRWTIWTYMNTHHQPWAAAMKPSWSLHAFCVIFSSFFHIFSTFIACTDTRQSN